MSSFYPDPDPGLESLCRTLRSREAVPKPGRPARYRLRYC